MCCLLFSLHNYVMFRRCVCGPIFAIIIDHYIMKGFFSRPRRSIKCSMNNTMGRTASRLQSVCSNWCWRVWQNLKRPECGFHMLDEGSGNDRWGRGTALNASALLVWTWSKVLSPLIGKDYMLIKFGEYNVQVCLSGLLHKTQQWRTWRWLYICSSVCGLWWHKIRENKKTLMLVFIDAGCQGRTSRSSWLVEFTSH